MAKANVTVVDIDPNGDVFLEDVMGPTKLRVSSKVLAQASDIFKAVIDHCKESISDHIAFSKISKMSVHGQNLTDNGGDLYTLPVPLPPVSKEASIVFLNVLHHRTKELPQKLSLELVLDIGFICDRYHCADALKPWSKMWLAGSDSRAAGDLAQSCKLLVTAHIFDDADSFSKISGNILLEKDDSFSTLPRPHPKLYFPWSSVLIMSAKLKMVLH